jgi:hypothetical protein
MRRMLVLALFVVLIASACGGGYAGNSPESAKEKAEAEMRSLAEPQFVFDHQEKGTDPLTREAWVVYFTTTSGFGSRSDSCVVYVRGDEATASHSCTP